MTVGYLGIDDDDYVVLVCLFIRLLVYSSTAHRRERSDCTSDKGTHISIQDLFHTTDNIVSTSSLIDHPFA